MDLIRESLMYKTNNLDVCMKTLTRQEQYEFMRLIFATRKDGVTICDCECSQYILCLVNRLGLERTHCLRVV
jgi:hypothetical protein